MKTKNLIHAVIIAIVVITISACNFNQSRTTTDSINQLSMDSVKAITKEAYIYGYPMIDGYRIQYAYFVDSKNPEYKGPWNTLRNIPHVYTSADKAVQTPNSDTPYSMAGLDLRAEPIILVVPKIDNKRYFSIQLINAYTQNFDYIGSRTAGNGGGIFMIAGPNWKGETPDGVTKVFNSETELILAVYRTQLFNADDIDNVKKVQAGYKVKTLSAYLGTPPPAAAATIDFALPLTPAAEKVSIETLNILNFLLQFCPTVPSEKELMERFARIGVGAGKTIDVASLSPEVKAAMEAGIKEAWDKDYAGLKEKINDGKVTSGDLFGTRAYLKNNYLYRMAAAVLGIYGNSKHEAMYPIYTVDAQEENLDATKNKYTLHFAADELPPVNAFWSLTMYKLPSSLLVANPLNRYLLNSPMLSSFKRDNDNGITFYIQNKSPGKDKESNWLPAPKGPFMAVLRLYWPKESALDGNWENPPIQLVK